MDYPNTTSFVAVLAYSSVSNIRFIDYKVDEFEDCCDDTILYKI